MTIDLPNLPYERNALEPHISAETLEYHHGKHHQAYVNKLNDFIKGTEHENQTLEEIIMSSEGGIFNNAAQVWNHSFYWNCLSPNVTTPSSELMQAIDTHFDSLVNFQNQFTAAACTQFGSGWAWLVKTAEGALEITTTSNANLPMTSNQTALLTCDVWEHAYYIDRRNSRPEYLVHFWPLVNWDFVNEQWASSQ